MSARAAVVGRPIAHSRSPLLHSTAYGLLGAGIDYGRIEAGEEDAPRLAAALRQEPGWRGLSVTMPLKRAMLALVDEASSEASALGALNTVVVSRAAGGAVRLRGENTDVQGVIGALGAAGLSGLAPAAWTPLVLGAGGTAAAALAALRRLGATSATVAVREPTRAGSLEGVAAALGIRCHVISLTSVKRLGQVPVVVSTLPPRAADAWAADVAALASPGAVLLDAAYDPWPSALAAAWAGRGARVVHGLSMLVHQAVEQMVLFSGDPGARDGAVVAALCDAVGITPGGEAL